MKLKLIATTFLVGSILSLNSNCSKKSGSTPTPPSEAKDSVNYWLTLGNQTRLLQKSAAELITGDGTGINIEIDPTKTAQTIDGFGYTMTGGSAWLINKLPADQKQSLLQEVFGNGDNSIKVSYLRVSIGASDLSREVFSYNDLPAGETDPTLSKFSLANDTVDLIPILKEVLAINPNIKIMGSPWSPPVWMKSNKSSIGGSLLPEFYSTYANYFVKYIQAMKANGIRIDAITIQNEPHHGGNNPSMVMNAPEQAEFIKNHLGPAFKNANIDTKIVIWDHNCNKPEYPIAVLNDPEAKKYIDGSAFHLYEGDISALSTVHQAHPDKNLYFTEQWTGAKGSFDGDIMWHIRNVIIGSLKHRSKIALEWNLANDGGFNPHTPGGCTECKGAITLDGTIRRNVAYYIIAHAAKFAPAGSVVVGTNAPGNAPAHIAMKTPEGKIVVIVLNDSDAASTFSIENNGKHIKMNMPAKSVSTVVF
jgi:glucosylceramidase